MRRIPIPELLRHGGRAGFARWGALARACARRSAVLAVLAAAMLGAIVGVRDASHFEVDVWPELSARRNALLRIVSNMFVLVFAFVFIWYGIKFVQFGWSQNSELAEMPMTYIFVAWPLAGFTWVMFLGERFLADVHIIRGTATAADLPPPRDPTHVSPE